MNDLLETEFFSLLAETSQEVTNEEMQNAYGQFTAHMEAVSSIKDNTCIFRMLNVSCIEVAHLQTVYRYEQGGNALKKAYIYKALSFLDGELELLRLKIHYPEQFRPSNQQTFVSDLYILPKSKDLGIV